TELTALIEALGLAWGAESVIVLYDVLELETEAAKQRMLTTCRWILRGALADAGKRDRKSTRLNSSHVKISYAVFCLKKKITKRTLEMARTPQPHRTDRPI